MEILITARIFGLPLIAWGGIITLSSLATTLLTGLNKSPLKTHQRLAYITIALAIFHGLAGLILLLF
ncbi:MAG: hypothetical protein KKC80_04715 [Candidatus Margulisbacteria bacterium]|nr:hypothetical protein [Candidatus Margulisiibacteriota bacterium]MBU1616762.1 hypothetical protein [Candidatus Margulisiibacteriota bacterium]